MTRGGHDPGGRTPPGAVTSATGAASSVHPISVVTSFFRKRSFAFCGLGKTADDKAVIGCAWPG